jgi:hypothetical protein
MEISLHCKDMNSFMMPTLKLRKIAQSHKIRIEMQFHIIWLLISKFR